MKHSLKGKSTKGGGDMLTAQRFKASEVMICEVVNAVSHQSVLNLRGIF